MLMAIMMVCASLYIRPVEAFAETSAEAATETPAEASEEDTTETSTKAKKINIHPISKRNYNGKEITPTVGVWALGKGLLEQDVDYVVSFSDNINAGEAKVLVTGIGNYYGEKTVSFTIRKKS